VLPHQWRRCFGRAFDVACRAVSSEGRVGNRCLDRVFMSLLVRGVPG
jgi:hypothetical protein